MSSGSSSGIGNSPFVFSFSFGFCVCLTRIYLVFLCIMVDRPLNEQLEWGGSMYRPTSATNTGGQTFLASQPAADTVQSQVPFTASNSDDLFAPATGGPSLNHPYILPNVPDFPHPHHNVQHTPTYFHGFSSIILSFLFLFLLRITEHLYRVCICFCPFLNFRLSPPLVKTESYLSSLRLRREVRSMRPWLQVCLRPRCENWVVSLQSPEGPEVTE